MDQQKQALLEESACTALAHYTGIVPPLRSGSTDCNIPLSLGIPALCVGVNIHEGIHTREEWIEKPSLIPGLEIALRVICALTEKENKV